MELKHDELLLESKSESGWKIKGDQLYRSRTGSNAPRVQGRPARRLKQNQNRYTQRRIAKVLIFLKKSATCIQLFRARLSRFFSRRTLAGNCVRSFTGVLLNHELASPEPALTTAPWGVFLSGLNLAEFLRWKEIEGPDS